MPPVDDDDLALQALLAYDTSFVPRYAQRFGERLLATLVPSPRPNVLDLGCRTGHPAVDLLGLFREGRVMALDADPRFLELARARADSELGRRIFFKQGRPTEIRFSADVFTHVVGNLLDRLSADRATVLREAWRVLRPGGQFVLTLALRGTFLEMIDLLREVALRYDLGALGERVEQYAATFPSTESLRIELQEQGFEHVRVERFEFTLDYRDGADVFVDPVIASAALAEWTWCAEGGPTADDVFAALRRTIDTYYEGRRFELTVVGACASARKPGALDDATP